MNGKKNGVTYSCTPHPTHYWVAYSDRGLTRFFIRVHPPENYLLVPENWLLVQHVWFHVCAWLPDALHIPETTKHAPPIWNCSFESVFFCVEDKNPIFTAKSIILSCYFCCCHCCYSSMNSIFRTNLKNFVLTNTDKSPHASGACSIKNSIQVFEGLLHSY